MEAWILGLIANAILALAYLAIALSILLPVLRSGQWRTNPLAVSTGLIFLSWCLSRSVRLFEAGLGPASADAFRIVLGDWRVLAADGIAAFIAIWYLTLRSRFPALLRGAALFEDARVRRRQAIEIHDNIVQGIVKAKLALELGETQQGIHSLDQTLTASRRIITELLGQPESDVALGPGDLRRSAPAGASR